MPCPIAFFTRHFHVKAMLLALMALLITMQSLNTQAASLKEMQSERKLLEQKLELMRRVLEGSSAARRIQSGSNPLAQERLTHARDQLNVAEQALQSGRLEAADERIDQAMKFYSYASGDIADAIERGEAQQTRFNELSVSIESFRLYVQRAMVKSEDANPLDSDRLSHLLQLASHLGASNNYGEANEFLNEAYMLTITAVSALRGGTTIVYSQDFDTPEQEYLYELDRYQGLVNLYRMVQPAENPSGKYAWTKKSLQAGNNAYQDAEHLAGRADYKAALEKIEEANKKISQVLRMMGLPIS